MFGRVRLWLGRRFLVLPGRLAEEWSECWKACADYSYTGLGNRPDCTFRIHP